tara:strand:- start:2875 stop:3795 length:921 start_codon:yes stop_codon:yes gene_type:complete
MKLKLAGIVLIGLLPFGLFAQEEDLLSLIENDSTADSTITYAEASFKTTRVVNGHSLENTHAGVLDFKITHRFGEISTGLYEMFGLDQASIRIGFDYGITERLMVGLGRSSWNKTYDGFLKYKLLRQSSGAKNMPVTVVWFSGMYVNSLDWAEPDRENYFSSRIDYAHQLIVGRKFTEGLTIQLMPSLVHRNLVESSDIANDVYALGVAGRQKITKRIAINAEYFYVFPDQIQSIYKNSLSLGLAVETGGHVFQVMVTNSTAMTENGFIAQNTGDWMDGDLRFGFNISRVFTLVKPKELKTSDADW